MSQEGEGAPVGEQQHVSRPVHSSQHAPAPSDAVTATGAAAAPAGAAPAKKQAKAEKKPSKKGDDLVTTMAALEVTQFSLHTPSPPC
jgi:hypothetical protein